VDLVRGRRAGPAARGRDLPGPLARALRPLRRRLGPPPQRRRPRHPRPRRPPLPAAPPPLLHGALRALPAAARRRLQAPARGAAPEPPAAAAARNEALAAFARAAALRIAPSAHLAALAAHLGPVELLPHGVDRPARRPLPAERRGPLLFLGTIAAHKGPDLVVRAWRLAFPEGDPPLALHGPVQDPALALGHPLGPPLDRAGVAAALAQARALVLGSRWPENAPLVALEARAAGCPVIAPALGGLPELVVPGRDGWLYPPGDVQALARTLRQAVAEPLAQLPALPPTVEEQVERLLSLYRGLLR
jgi:glycosyltransferase involved in cell wall biosynthesis